MVGTFMTDPSGDGSVSAPFKALGVRAYKWGRLGEGRGRACTETPVRKLKSQTETQRGGLPSGGEERRGPRSNTAVCHRRAAFSKPLRQNTNCGQGSKTASFVLARAVMKEKHQHSKLHHKGRMFFAFWVFVQCFFFLPKAPAAIVYCDN